ncbi:hypothetical protein [Allokutzneria sp. NRRL B-24872]|uniref:hypothetical protein n=1 Tax=Allokutzneria sp. NRRL B-24872 TaxID=1137961 RepID=UPI000A3C7131|nr:hypothetical protein [Allokutzneria sp. NRRL B-24872]
MGTVLWIGGGQWAGKTTVSRILAERFGLTAYHYDFHDARGHFDRAMANAIRYPHRNAAVNDSPDEQWVHRSPQRMAADCLRGFAERFEMVLDDLRALSTTRPLIAEGWGLRPELVATRVTAPDQAVFLVPSEEFRQRQLRELDRARSLAIGHLAVEVSDPVLAQENRVARDRLLAGDAARSARLCGFRVITVDGELGAGGVADEVQEHFRAHLPRR